MNSRRIILDFERGTLVVRGLAHEEARGLGLTWDERIGAARGYAITYQELRAELMREFGGATGAVVDHLTPPHQLAWPKLALPVLRAEQREALSAWQAAGGRGMVVMPT